MRQHLLYRSLDKDSKTAFFQVGVYAYIIAPHREGSLPCKGNQGLLFPAVKVRQYIAACMEKRQLGSAFYAQLRKKQDFHRDVEFSSLDAGILCTGDIAEVYEGEKAHFRLGLGKLGNQPIVRKIEVQFCQFSGFQVDEAGSMVAEAGAQAALVCCGDQKQS